MNSKHKTKNKTTEHISRFAVGMAIGGLCVYGLLRIPWISEEERITKSEPVKRAKKMLSDALNTNKKN